MSYLSAAFDLVAAASFIALVYVFAFILGA